MMPLSMIANLTSNSIDHKTSDAKNVRLTLDQRRTTYHVLALETLAQIADQKRGSEARRLARATLTFLATQGDRQVQELTSRWA